MKKIGKALRLLGELGNIGQGVALILGAIALLVGAVRELPWPITLALTMAAVGVGLIVATLILQQRPARQAEAGAVDQRIDDLHIDSSAHSTPRAAGRWQALAEELRQQRDVVREHYGELDRIIGPRPGAPSASVRAIGFVTNPPLGDILAEKYERGVALLNASVTSDKEFQDWLSAEGEWTGDLLTEMRHRGCDKAEISALRNLGGFALGAFDQDINRNWRKSMLAERLNRLRVVMLKYGKEAPTGDSEPAPHAELIQRISDETLPSAIPPRVVLRAVGNVASNQRLRELWAEAGALTSSIPQARLRVRFAGEDGFRDARDGLEVVEQAPNS